MVATENMDVPQAPPVAVVGGGPAGITAAYRLTAMRAVENVLEGAGHDLWSIDAESVYHVEDAADEQPCRRLPPAVAVPAADTSAV